MTENSNINQQNQPNKFWNFWTTLPGIITATGTLLGSGGLVALIQIFKPQMPASNPSPQTRIEVDAKSERGTPYTNSKDKPVQIKFHAQGKWLAIPQHISGDNLPKGYMSPDGSGDFASNPNKVCPGYPLGALVVKKSQGNCIASGTEGTINLEPGQTVYFLINDVKSLYNDNEGIIKVDLSVVN
ncbi:MAG TPA: hypothetical protein DCY88_34355 [Cyanobacteria bacterium UBA11372]|nr:hypothetical protein [Cyanobacteria bacterium UBA11372]